MGLFLTFLPVNDRLQAFLTRSLPYVSGSFPRLLAPRRPLNPSSSSPQCSCEPASESVTLSCSGLWQVDQYGRKRGSIAFALLYIWGALSYRSSALPILFMGRIISGIATSLLFSAPEVRDAGPLRLCLFLFLYISVFLCLSTSPSPSLPLHLPPSVSVSFAASLSLVQISVCSLLPILSVLHPMLSTHHNSQCNPPPNHYFQQAWLVGEHQRGGFDASELSQTFGLACVCPLAAMSFVPNTDALLVSHD